VRATVDFPFILDGKYSSLSGIQHAVTVSEDCKYVCKDTKVAFSS
jgi:hypothetical protein